MKKPIDIKVTPQGYADLKEEFTKLTERRPGVLTRMVQAREQGDLSENAGYHAGKEELGKIDSRLRQLKLILRFADVVKSNQQKFVQLGNTVTIKNQNVEATYTIVGALEADPAKNRMSDASPIGKALIGKVKGELVNIEIPDGTITYEVVEIK